MFFVWLGSLALSICVLVSVYLLIRLAVRDGIDSSSTADWKEMYAQEQDRSTTSMPSLDSMYRDAEEMSFVKSLPLDQRHAEAERFVATRARKVVREARHKRFVLTVVGIIIGAVISGVMIFGGLQATAKKKQPSYYHYGSYSNSYDDHDDDNPFDDYLSQYD
ncbi:MAG: hypothetical protein U0N15_10455 [Bifidobacterium choerinum]